MKHVLAADDHAPRELPKRRRHNLIGHDAAAFIRFAFRNAVILLARGRPHAIARCDPRPGASSSSLRAISVKTVLVTASRAGSRRSTIPTTPATTRLTITASSRDRGPSWSGSQPRLRRPEGGHDGGFHAASVDRHADRVRNRVVLRSSPE